MNGTEQIRKALSTIMTEAEANACQIQKSWFRDAWLGDMYCWWYKPFGKAAQPLGSTIYWALHTIEDWHVQQLQDQHDS